MIHKQLAIFENASDAILVSDDSQRIVFWNNQAEELLGFTSEEVIGKRCYKIVGQCLADQQQAAPGCCALCHATEAPRHGATVATTHLVLRGRDGAEQVVDVDHTFLFPQQAGQNSPYLIMHFLRKAVDEERGQHGLRIRLLGQTQVGLAGGEQTDGALLQRRMVRTLLAVLALHREQGIHRDLLLDLLWPDKEREPALANLNTNVYYLRRALQPDLARGEQSRYVQIEGEHYRLAPDVDIWVDVEEFEESVSRAQHTTKGSEAIALYERALELYQGEFLAGLDLADGHYWIRAQHLCERHLTTMKKLAALYEATGQDQRAEALYVKILGKDPLREDACRQAMRLMLRRGDRSGAIMRFRRFERNLASELGVSPDPETIALYRQARGLSTSYPTNGRDTGAFSIRLEFERHPERLHEPGAAK